MRANARMGDVVDLMAGTEADLAEVMTQAMGDVAVYVKNDWREAIIEAGLGPRVANTIRAKVYPDHQFSLDAAAWIDTKSPKIIDASSRVQTIRSKTGRWLAWQTEAAGPKRISPANWERRTGLQLVFIPLRGGQSALLVAPNARLTSKGRAARNIGASRGGGGYTRLKGRTTVIVYTLHRSTTTKKRWDLDALAARGLAQLDGAIAKYWQRIPDRTAPMMIDDNGRPMAPFRRYSGPPVRFG